MLTQICVSVIKNQTSQPLQIVYLKVMCNSYQVIIMCAGVPFERGYMDHSSEGLL